jgi:exosome complex component RRP4
MIAFVSFPAPSANTEAYGVLRHHLDVEEDALMDLDDDVETGRSKLTCPGESLTSAQAFMR